ncbi:MAG: hypothetical protein NZ585_02435 [Chloracidobacterium sp.]|nr:hypothetical protein [Chloracidobacterium sp.]MDW8218726.1 hypothetical protein [Acidobacteriota bacterium]
MSLMISMLLVGSLVGEPIAAASDPWLAAQASSQSKKQPRRPPRRSAPPTEPTPLPDDLPLGAQELLVTIKAGGMNPLVGASPSAAAAREAVATPSENSESTEAPLSPEEVWRRAVEEAREELRDAEAEKQRQDNADSPPPPGQDASLRVFKARENLRRLLEEGKAKQYRERPVETQP